MKKRIIALFVAVMVVLTLSSAAFADDAILLRLANSHNAEHITSQACQMFADLVNGRTEGRITI